MTEAMTEALILGFDKSIGKSETKYHIAILDALELNVNSNTVVSIIDKPVLLSTIRVVVNMGDWPLAISMCEGFFKDDVTILGRVHLIKQKVLEIYERQEQIN